MDISRKPYEISIWEDKASIHPTTNKRFFEESLIAIIGSDTMDTPIRAFNPLFNLNINGTSTLTFQIFSTYYDEEKDEEVENPFLKLLVNERKLKLRYDNGNRKWFDFIIKDVQEDSTTNTFSYTAYDLHIEELSKTGFEIELNPELENNQGTIVELGEKVLKGSDWKVRPNASDIFRQTIKEPLYEIVLNQNITAYNMIDNQLIPITITSGKTIYGFYSCITEKNPYFQFLYHATNGYEVDDDRIVLNAPSGSNYYINNVTYRDGTYSPVPSFSTSNAPPIAELYRGERLVRQQSIVYDSKIEKYVNVYKSGDTTIYGLEETEYIGATITKNFISNNEEFVTTHGWIPSTNTTIKDIIYPPIIPTLNIQATNFTPYLQFKFTNSNAMLMNTGIQDNRASINNIAKGEKYVLRFKYKMGATPSITPTGDKRLIGIVGAYTLDSSGNYQITKTYITFSPASTVVDGDTGFSYIIGTASNALSLSEMVNSRIGFFLRPGATSVGETYWLENLELFKYNTGNNGNMVVPGVPPEGIIKTIYSYYDPSSTYESLEDIQFIYRGDTPSPSYAKSYDPNFAKVRSITAAESNRYNLLQTLAETFECWVKFEIEYDEATGKMLREADGRLKKWISFHHFIGQDNQVGFHYGINVNAISRQILSDQIVTKLIVKNNSNQFAEDGFCSIARAPENPPKENFLFNFKYYIQQGLLSYAEVHNDLYSNFGSWIGYFAKLRTINQNRENLIKKYSLLSVEATKLESDYQTYTLVKNEANEQVLFLKAELHQYTGLSYESLLSGTAAAKLKLADPKVKEIIKELETHSNVSKKYTPLSTIYKDNLEATNAELKDIIAQLEVDRASKDALGKEFYDKYSSFIKEGSWISEDYVDDNLYYLDAESVLYTSSSPQISYNINVLELSALEEYKAYNFNLGDKTYIEHTEFFGWVFGPNGEKTPYREEIVVSQVSYSLDDPSQNQITVQNYKNQFEELFQRITATVQAVQYQTGALARVAGIVETDGTIKTNTLQNSLANNQFLISNAADQSVQWDQSGITITNLRKPNEVLRLISGGILLTTDGGLSWNYGMTGAGMNADFITAGQIDASRINIVGGAFSAFRWDHTGLNAYGLTRDEMGTPLWFNFNEFVRFDQFGLYGFHGGDSFVPSTEGDIWADPGTKFALTWKGFLLRSGKEDGGYLLLDSERDFVIVDGDGTERVRIGNLNPPELTSRYGIQLKNSNNQVVLESSDTGSLFLRELLSIGPNSYAPRTQLGVISTNEDDVSKIFAINNKNDEEQLAMFDDGRIVAKNGEFHGGIFADYGKIGNMTIEAIEEATEYFVLKTTSNTFRITEGVSSPLSATLTVDHKNIPDIVESMIIWEWTTNFVNWTSFGVNGANFTLIYTDHSSKFSATGMITVRARLGKWNSFVNISRVSDGNDPITYLIESSNGNQFKDNGLGTILTARLFKNGVEIDPNGITYTYTWTKWVNNIKDTTFGDRTGKSLTLLNSDVQNQAVFRFEAV